jgi:hypothetical protein
LPRLGYATPMERMDSNRSTVAPVQAVFKSARQFGLGEGEVMRTFDEALWTVGEDAPMSEYLDELSAALARRILAKERQNRSRTIPE